MKKFFLLFLTCIMVMSGTVMSFAEEGGEARLSVSVANDGKITFSCTGDIQEDYYVGVGGGERNGWVDGITMSWSAYQYPTITMPDYGNEGIVRFEDASNLPTYTLNYAPGVLFPDDYYAVIVKGNPHDYSGLDDPYLSPEYEEISERVYFSVEDMSYFVTYDFDLKIDNDALDITVTPHGGAANGENGFGKNEQVWVCAEDWQPGFSGDPVLAGAKVCLEGENQIHLSIGDEWVLNEALTPGRYFIAVGYPNFWFMSQKVFFEITDGGELNILGVDLDKEGADDSDTPDTADNTALFGIVIAAAVAIGVVAKKKRTA